MMGESGHESGSEGQFVLENQADGSKTPVEGTLKVGRDAACELVLDCTKCSRVHAEVGTSDGSLWIEDRNSTNGTFVNNREIGERTGLRDGDIVQFGDARFRVVAPPSPEPEDDGEKTVVASRESFLQMLEQESEGGSGTSDQATASESERAGESAGSPTSDASSRSDEREPRSDDGAPPEAAAEPEASSAESGDGIDPSIPGSWADADQLEQASHTSVLAGGALDTSGPGSPVLNPSKAVEHARQQIPEDLAILIGLTNPVLGTLFELPVEDSREKWEIGRGKGADIEIDAESVSGRHCQLIHEKGRWKIVNMMSVNGTFVNGRKVLSAYLKAGDVIGMGGVELVFDARVKRSRAGPRTGASSAERGSRAGRALTAPFRWVGRLFSRFVGRG